MRNTNPNTLPRSTYDRENEVYDRDYDYTRIPSDLQRLDELDNYKVAEDETDPRGFAVVGRDGEEIGSINSLLASPSEGKALFAIVETGGWFSGKKYVIPLRMIQFDHEDEKAFGPFTKADFENAPEYREGDSDFNAYYVYWNERDVADTDVDAVVGEKRVADTVDEFRVPVTEETAEVRKERRRAGYLTVHKNVETETRHISEPVTHTRVSVETREVADGDAYNRDLNTTELKEGETL
ncbi:MAG: PRC and DUF2382 domain-containing protein, partial [Armatimonadetes bacterium]|nr:PRC and DUF2382 domain-containing protein [Armatimonadota bacterium]